MVTRRSFTNTNATGSKTATIKVGATKVEYTKKITTLAKLVVAVVPAKDACRNGAKVSVTCASDSV